MTLRTDRNEALDPLLADMGKSDSFDQSNHIDTRAESSDGLREQHGVRPGSPSVTRPPVVRSLSRISTSTPVVYKLYKRRFFGLGQLILLNIVTSWAWTSFAPISDTVAQYFDVTESAINWLSTAYFFAFVAATPFTFYALSKHGPKTSIVVGAVLTLTGNWVKYGGAKSNRYAVVMLGQILIGAAQTFVLSAPTTYSNLWFSSTGRTSATAVASLSNALGAAVGQLVSPLWTLSPADVPNTVLYTSVIGTVASLPAFFIPARPPSPPTPGSMENIADRPPLMTELKTLFKSYEFYASFLPFSVYVGFFNAISSLLNQILGPYGFSQDDAGIAGALLIVVGIVAAAISSPLIDRYKCYLTYIKVTVPILAIMYLVFIWAPPSRSIPFVYVVCAIMGASSFSLVPVVLEFIVEIFHPLGPETGSTVCWCGGQLLGGIFVIIMNNLKSNNGGPENNMQRALIFQAVVSLLVMPLPLTLGLFGRHNFVRRKRWETEKRVHGNVDIEEDNDDEVRVLGNGGNHEVTT